MGENQIENSTYILRYGAVNMGIIGVLRVLLPFRAILPISHSISQNVYVKLLETIHKKDIKLEIWARKHQFRAIFYFPCSISQKLFEV